MGRRNGENNDRRTEQFRKLFIGGLTPQTDEIRLKKYYEQWGELVDFVVMKDNKTGRSRGFGFVTYRDPAMVDEAQSNRPHEIDGKLVEAKRAMPREDSHTPESHMTVNKLFVGGLKKDVSKDQLKEYFQKFGSVVDCEIVTWKDSGESRGFGFVTFDDYDPVDKAILYKPHQIASSKVDVKKALSKDEMEEIKRKQTIDSISLPNTMINTDYYSNNNNSIKQTNYLSNVTGYISPQNNTNNISSNPTSTIQSSQTQSYNTTLPYLNNVLYDPSLAYQYSTIGWNNGPIVSPTYYFGHPNLQVQPTDLNISGQTSSQYACSQTNQSDHTIVNFTSNLLNNSAAAFLYDPHQLHPSLHLNNEDNENLHTNSDKYESLQSQNTNNCINGSTVNLINGEPITQSSNPNNISIFQ